VAVIFEKAGDTATSQRLRATYGIPDEKDDGDDDDEAVAPPTIKNAGKLDSN
jgi:hypothetical protein